MALYRVGKLHGEVQLLSKQREQKILWCQYDFKLSYLNAYQSMPEKYSVRCVLGWRIFQNHFNTGTLESRLGGECFALLYIVPCTRAFEIT